MTKMTEGEFSDKIPAHQPTGNDNKSCDARRQMSCGVLVSRHKTKTVRARPPARQ